MGNYFAWVLILILFSLCYLQAQRIIYLSTEGTDENNNTCLDPYQPCSSISYIFDKNLVEWNDTILLASGVYYVDKTFKISVPFSMSSWNVSESDPIITSTPSFRLYLNHNRTTHSPLFFVNHTQIIEQSIFKNISFTPDSKFPISFSFSHLKFENISQLILFSVNSTSFNPYASQIEPYIKYQTWLQFLSADCSTFEPKIFSFEPSFIYFDLGRNRIGEPTIDYDIFLFDSLFNTVKLFDSRSSDLTAPLITIVADRVTFSSVLTFTRLRLTLNNKNMKNNFINSDQTTYKFFNVTNIDRLQLKISNCYFYNIRFYIAGMNLLQGLSVRNSTFDNSVLEVYLISSQVPSVIDNCLFTRYRNMDQSSSVTSAFIWYGTASIILKNSKFIDNDLGIRSVSPVINNIQRLQITNCQFINNTAAIMCDSALIALIIESSTFLNNNVLKGNRMLSPVQIDSSYFASIVSCTFKNNRGFYGGAVMVSFCASKFEIIDSYLSNNEASNAGGALYVSTDSMDVRGSQLVSNSANEEGGAVFTTSKDPTFYSVTFHSNTAELGNGGAVCIRNTIAINTTIESLRRRTTFSYVTFERNQALQGKGGALFAHNANMYFTSIISFYNVAKIGGAIAMDASSLSFRTGLSSSILIIGNRAFQYGGAIAFTNCLADSLTASPLVHLNFDGNRASIAGGVFFIDETSNTNVVSNTTEALLINFLDTSTSRYGNTKASDPRRFLFKSLTMGDANYTIADMPFSIISNIPFSMTFELLDAYGQTVIDFVGFIAELEIISQEKQVIETYSNLVLRSLDGTNFHFTNLKFEFSKPNIPFQVKVKRSDSIQSIANMEPLYLNMITADCPNGQALTLDRDSKSKVCVDCLPGFYKTANITTECMPCPQGTFAEQPGSAVCDRCGFFSIDGLTNQQMTSQFQCYISTIVISLILGLFIFCLAGTTALIVVVALSLSLRKSKKREKTALEEALLGSNHGHSLMSDSQHLIEMSMMEQLMNSKYMISFSELTDMEQIGSGAFGVVLKCKWKKQMVAIKLVRPGLQLEDQQLTDFYKEVELMAQLRHPHVVNFLGMCVSRQPMKVGIVMEYCALGNLRQVIENHKHKLNWSQRLNILLDICRGMHFLHSKKIIHRDLKIDNILITSKLNAKIGDFGTSRTIEAIEKVQQMTKRVGSSLYMSPEVVRGEPYNEKADIYSFGIIMYELLMLQTAYQNFDWSMNIEWKVANDPNMRPQYPIESECVIEELKAISSASSNGSKNISSLSSSAQIWDDSMVLPSIEEIDQYIEFSKRCWAHSAEDRPSFDESITFFESLSATLM